MEISSFPKLNGYFCPYNLTNQNGRKRVPSSTSGSIPMAFTSAIPRFSPLTPPKHSNCVLKTPLPVFSQQPQHRRMDAPVKALGPRTLFLQAGFNDSRPRRRIQAKSTSTDSGGTSIGFGSVGEFSFLLLSFSLIEYDELRGGGLLYRLLEFCIWLFLLGSFSPWISS